MSELDKFIQSQQLDSQNAKETPFDVKFVKVVNEINQSVKEEVIYTGGSFKDK